MEQNLLPVLDTKKLKERADEAALKGAIEEINDFYCGYNSPYRKALKEQLEKYPMGLHFELPDIIATINDSISKEIDLMANKAIAKTYIQDLKKFLTREPLEIKFSEFLQEFVNLMEAKEQQDVEIEVSQKPDDIKFGWLKIRLAHKERHYEFNFHKVNHSIMRPDEHKNDKAYKLMSLPYNFESDYGNSYSEKKIKINIEEGDRKIDFEMPFTRDIIKDEFLSYMARLIMCETVITMDTEDFDENMFPEQCHC